MCYVPTESEMSLIRSDKDLSLFAMAHARRVKRVVDAMTAPFKTEKHFDDNGKPFTVRLHAETGLVLDVC